MLAASSVTLRKSFNLSELQFLHSLAIVATAMRKINQDTGIECDRGSCFRGGGQGRPLGGVEGRPTISKIPSDSLFLQLYVYIFWCFFFIPTIMLLLYLVF